KTAKENALHDAERLLAERDAAYTELEGQEQKTRDALDREERTSYLQRILRAGRETEGNLSRRLDELLGECQPRLRGWEWYRLHRVARPELWRGRHPDAATLTWSPDGATLLTVAANELATAWECKVWDAGTGEVRKAAGGRE